MKYCVSALLRRAKVQSVGAFVSVLAFVGCTTAAVRWDAIGVREQVMKFYNDEVMDNLINMNKGLPYVHVDISTVSAAAASQVTGSVGGGNTRVFGHPGVLGVAGTISRSVTRPFSWSVTPLRSDTLTITEAPVIGTLSDDGAKPSSTLVSSKITETRDKPDHVKETSTEFTPQSAPTITIYDVYERYGKKLARDALMESIGRPGPNEYVPGALRWREGKFYYIPNSTANQAAYTKLCMALLKQGRAKPSGTAISEAAERTLNEFQDLKARESLPQQTLTVPR